MIRKIALAVLALAFLAVTHNALYWQTRDKWRELGRNSGVIAGQAAVLEALMPLAEPGAPPSPPVYTLVVKSGAIYLVADGTGYRLYYQE